MVSSSARAVYTALSGHLRKISRLGGIQQLLEWDQQVMMPSGASNARGEQMATLSGMMHDLQTSNELGSMLGTLTSSAEYLNKTPSVFNEYELATIRLAKRNYDRETRIPKEIAEESARLASEGFATWVRARQESNFSLFAPVLLRWVDLKKRMASLIDPERPAYDVLLDDFERDMTTQRLDEIFEQLKKGLIPLFRQIMDTKNKAAQKPEIAFLEGPAGTFSVADQEELSRRISKDIGFDFERGRLDVSVHPFTIGAHSTDVRITTRYKDTEFIQGLAGTVHETGHALYEQGLNAEHDGLPVAAPLSMGLHESQSLLWERHVGLSKPFWTKYWPVVQSTFPAAKVLQTKSAEEAYKAINDIEPNFIRVESDEVTYPMHIILRYEIEKDLINGAITVEQIPAIWNSKMHDYLGITPPSDKLGVLQDAHWSGGAIGYFPTYSLGAMCACQLFKTAHSTIPDLDDKIAAGEFQALKQWLNQEVHKRGSLLSADDLMKTITGEPLNPQFFLDYLRIKYGEIYGF